jgi:predicted ATPase
MNVGNPIPRLRSLKLKGILSFGAEMELSLRPLNVFVGANGSGKTNLLEVLALLRALPLPRGLAETIRQGGGINHWLWKGPGESRAEIETTWRYITNDIFIRHKIGISHDKHEMGLDFEEVEAIPSGEATGGFGHASPNPVLFGDRSAPNPEGYVSATLLVLEPNKLEDERKPWGIAGLDADKSVLAQFQDPKRAPELNYIRNSFMSIYQYRRWLFGPESPLRTLQRAEMATDFLLEDCRNLSQILRELLNEPEVEARVNWALGKLYDGISGIEIREIGDFLQLNLVEEVDRVIPSERLSDGTLRYLSLLAILCHPNPPPLICIEEPELGLHPDVISTVADLLIEASTRTQLIVTTHSEGLIDALGEEVESVVVCDRGIDGTEMKRLEADRLAKWLEKYRLGDLWARGAIGGTRW